MTSAEIERIGTSLLIQRLEAAGRAVRKSDTKTFDLIVDGLYAEVKAKGKGLDRFDFFVLSDKQFQALSRGEQFLLFLVLNVLDPAHLNVIEIPSEILRRHHPKVWIQYFWDRGMLERIRAELPHASHPAA